VTRQLPASRRVTASGLLGLFLLIAMPLGPVLTVLLGMADRSHHVAIQRADGGIQVVLRHDCANSPTHRHGLVARALTLIARRPVQSQPDHVIQFLAGPTLDNEPPLISLPSADETGPQLFPACTDLPHLACLSATLATQPRPPPGTGGMWSNIRSVVLLL
jgi:hypothetical protein